MQGLMQDFPLTLQHLLWRMERLFPKKEIVSLRDDGVHRYTYPELVRRICRVANALTRLGVKPGDRVATVAWNNHRHMELYYAVPCMGAVLHTVNLRLFPDQLAHVINDAADRFVFADATLMPVLERVAGRIPCVERVIRMADRAEAPPATPSLTPQGAYAAPPPPLPEDPQAALDAARQRLRDRADALRRDIESSGDAGTDA